MLNGVIDISHYQANVDFAKLRASGVVAVIHKASEGTDHTDELYSQQRTKAIAAGLLWGAYHLGTNTSAAEQVANFIKSAKPDADTLLALQWQDLGGGESSSPPPPTTSTGEGEIAEGKQQPVATPMSAETPTAANPIASTGELDTGKSQPVAPPPTASQQPAPSTPSTGKTMTVDQVRQFCTLLEQKTGMFPVLCSGSVAKRELGDQIDPLLENCPFWIIQYADHPTDIPRTFKTFALWQYTNGEVGPEPHEALGVGPCFRDRFNGDERELSELWGQRNSSSAFAAKQLLEREPRAQDDGLGKHDEKRSARK